jgi:hypothetical protein
MFTADATSKRMRVVLLTIAFALVSIIAANAQVYSGYSSYSGRAKSSSSYYSGSTSSSVRYQSGYTRSNGTYVQGHYKTNSNSTNHDNFSTSGNYNSFTGSAGTRARDYSSGAYNYGSGKTIHTGSRGGQYYINSNGNKTYVPKR